MTRYVRAIGRSNTRSKSRGGFERNEIRAIISSFPLTWFRIYLPPLLDEREIPPVGWNLKVNGRYGLPPSVPPWQSLVQGMIKDVIGRPLTFNLSDGIDLSLHVSLKLQIDDRSRRFLPLHSVILFYHLDRVNEKLSRPVRYGEEGWKKNIVRAPIRTYWLSAFLSPPHSSSNFFFFSLRFGSGRNLFSILMRSAGSRCSDLKYCVSVLPTAIKGEESQWDFAPNSRCPSTES